jgi:DNA-binding transcriptional ArsR family regulator
MLTISNFVDNLHDMSNAALVRLADFGARSSERSEDELLDAVFFALSDPIRRAILARLGEETLLVSELAEPFDVSLQSVSRHIQVLVRAGLVQQERTGRISRCRLDVGPIYSAAVWMNRYSKYWQEQFGMLAAALEAIDEQKRKPAPKRKRRRRASARRKS